MSIEASIKRFQSKKRGIFFHFLDGHDGKAWSERVDLVDVEL